MPRAMLPVPMMVISMVCSSRVQVEVKWTAVCHGSRTRNPPSAGRADAATVPDIDPHLSRSPAILMHGTPYG